jgi:hypothetical protein
VYIKEEGNTKFDRKPEEEEPLGKLRRIIKLSVFERNWMGGFDCFY